MRLRRFVASLVLACLLGSFWQSPFAFAASSFSNEYLTLVVSTPSSGGYLTSVNADPGDTIQFFLKVRNMGADTATNSFLTMPLTDLTYTSYSTYWAWNSASNNLNSSAGEVMFAPLYVDADASGSVTAGDLRVNRYGINSASTDGKYAAGSTVAGGESDVGSDLTDSATNYIYITGGNATFSAGEYAYVKGSGNNNSGDVQVGDVRVNAVGSYAIGQIVISGDTDICTSCLTVANNIKRFDDGNESNNTLWPLDETGFPLGDLGANKQVVVKSTTAVVNMNAPATISPSFTITADNSSPSETIANATIHVDTTPSITSVTFTPGSITNDDVSSTTATVVATDKNGADDIASVTLNLTALGGSSTATLYDDGTHGDAIPNNGTWTLDGITTSSGANTYNLTATATDSTAQTANNSGSLIVQAGGTPAVTLNSITDDEENTTDRIIGASGDVTIAWQADEAIYKYELRIGSCSGALATGTNVADGDGSAQILATATPVSSILANANFSAGANSVYVCATDADANVGQNFTTITKDLTAPTVTIQTISPGIVTTGGTSTVSWYANEAGSYTLRVGSCAGALATGANASGTYVSGTIQSVFNTADLAEGANSVYACLTDYGANAGSANGSLTRDTSPPSAVSGVTLADNDVVNDGVNGYDLTIGWTPAANDPTFGFYKLYVLPEATTLNMSTHVPVKIISSGQATSTWTGDGTRTTDSNNDTFGAGNHKAYVVATDGVGQASSAAASAVATLVLDDLAAPSFTSANTADVNTVRLVFSEPISFVDTNKITATGLTIDTAYNANGYTSGVKIGTGADTNKVYLRVNALATNYTASDLALGACAVRDVTGSNNLNEAGNCTSLVPATNAIAAISAQTISDGVGPILTLTSPAASSRDNATLAVAYTLSETANPNSVTLKFTGTGGTADSNSPHTITLTDALVGADAEASGAHAFTLNAGSFTSQERGAGDTLVPGAIYTVTLNARDTTNNAGNSASSTNFTYDTTAPSATATAQNFSSPTASTAPTFNWSTVADAASYTLEVSLSATNYSPLFVTQNISAPTTSWTLDPAFAADGLDDATYIWRVFVTDEAGNISAASNQQTFTLSTQTNTPTIILRDTTNASATHTNSQNINVTLDTYSATATHYLLSESQSTQPDADAITTALPGLAPQTVAFALSAGEGVKTVYVWVKDNLGNVSADVSSATITVDTTLPATPTVVASDANSGAASGKTNSAAIALAITNDTDNVAVAKWCVKSDDTSDGAPGAPNESTCSAPAGGSASGWLTSRPTTHTLASTGAKTVYVWTMDAAGNISSVGTSAIDYATALPADPTLTLTDQTSLSTSYTNSTTVNTIISGALWKCIVSTTQSSQPSETSASWADACPGTLNLGSGDGSKTAYIWVKDTYGNINTNQVATAITLDTTAPQILSALTRDLDGDGEIDALRITMSEAVFDSTISRAHFALGSGYTFSALTGSLGSFTFADGFSTGSIVNNDVFYLAVTSIGALDTDVTPTLTYTAGTLTDLAENSLANTAGFATDDGVAPRLITTNPIRVLDLDSNGKADQIKIIYSESLDTGTTLTTSPWTLANIPSGGTLLSVARGTTTKADDTIILTLTEGGSGVDTTAGTANISLANSAEEILDTSNNFATDFTAASGADFMGPILVSANYLSTGDVANDSLILTFSEPIDDASIDIPADFEFVNGGAIPNSDFATGATANDDTIVIELNAGDTAPGVGVSTIWLSGVSVVADTSAMANVNTGIAGVAIRGGLVINEIQWAGMGGVTNDQYFELRNMSSGAAVNFATDNHILCRGASTIKALTSGSIAAGGYFLVSNMNRAMGKIDVDPDLAGFTSPLLSGGTFTLTLRTGTNCAGGVILDTAWNGTALTVGANDVAMERNDAPGEGSSSASWHPAVATSASVPPSAFDTANQKGTPRAANIADATAPSFTLAMRTPAHQTLFPASPATLSVDYADNAGGVGVNTNSITLEVDLNGDGDFGDANEGTGGICSGDALTTKSATRVVCTLTETLTAGRHSVRVIVADMAGNSASTTWDFWVDDFTFTAENLTAELGVASAGSPVFTNDNTRHTKLTLTTYGAGVSILGSADGALTGPANIPWHAQNTATAGIGAAWRVKEGVTGIFGNYFNFSAPRTIATKSKFTGAELVSANALQTYTFYVQYYASVDALQAPGNYAQNVSYDLALEY